MGAASQDNSIPSPASAQLSSCHLFADRAHISPTPHAMPSMRPPCCTGALGSCQQSGMHRLLHAQCPWGTGCFWRCILHPQTPLSHWHPRNRAWRVSPSHAPQCKESSFPPFSAPATSQHPHCLLPLDGWSWGKSGSQRHSLTFSREGARCSQSSKTRVAPEMGKAEKDASSCTEKTGVPVLSGWC